MSTGQSTSSAGPGPWMPRMTTKVSTVGIIAGAKMIVDANPNRYFLMMGLFAGSSANVGVQSPPAMNIGFILSPTQPPLRFHFSDDGEIVQEQWWLGNNGTSAPIYVVEGIWNVGVQG